MHNNTYCFIHYTRKQLADANVTDFGKYRKHWEQMLDDFVKEFGNDLHRS